MLEDVTPSADKGKADKKMARTKGALNKRTRVAMHDAKSGKLLHGGESPVQFLLRVMKDAKRPIELRVDAAKAAAPFLHARLSHVENVELSPNDRKTDAQLDEEIKAVFSRATPEDRAKMALWLVPEAQALMPPAQPDPDAEQPPTLQ